MQLLDLLTLVSEDIGAAKFATVAARRPWVAEFGASMEFQPPKATIRGS